MQDSDKHIITLFYNFLKGKNKALHSSLAKGLSEGKIEAALQALPFTVPEEVSIFYTHKNGYKADRALTLGQSWLLENGCLMSLEDSIMEYNTSFWLESELKHKLPLFDSGGGDFLMIDCDEKSETYKKILIWSPALLIIEPIVIYGSLISLLSTTIRCLMVGAYFYNDKGELEIEERKQYMEAIRINPRAPYWKALSSLFIPDYPWY